MLGYSINWNTWLRVVLYMSSDNTKSLVFLYKGDLGRHGTRQLYEDYSKKYKALRKINRQVMQIFSTQKNFFVNQFLLCLTDFTICTNLNMWLLCQNITEDNRTPGDMDKSQWDLRHIRFRSARFTRLDDFVVQYQIVHKALLKEYKDNKRAFPKKIWQLWNIKVAQT